MNFFGVSFLKLQYEVREKFSRKRGEKMKILVGCFEVEVFCHRVKKKKNRLMLSFGKSYWRSRFLKIHEKSEWNRLESQCPGLCQKHFFRWEIKETSRLLFSRNFFKFRWKAREKKTCLDLFFKRHCKNIFFGEKIFFVFRGYPSFWGIREVQEILN